MDIELKELSKIAENCHAYAKALHYKEVELLLNPSSENVGNLIRYLSLSHISVSLSLYIAEALLIKQCRKDCKPRQYVNKNFILSLSLFLSLPPSLLLPLS